MKQMHRMKQITIFALMVFLMINNISCRVVSVKQVPRDYVNNYDDVRIKAKRSDWKLKKGDVWVVFSDRKDNPTYRRPGGKVEQIQTAFLEPFIVVKQNGDYLKLIKFNPNIMRDKKVKNKKDAEVCGWMHKSNLLLHRQSISSVSTGLKNKYTIVLSDTTTFNSPELYFKTDSVRVYYDVNNTIEKSATPLHEIVYVMKYSRDKKKALISTTSDIQVSNVGNKILGWVDNATILNTGQKLYVNLPDADSDINDINKINVNTQNNAYLLHKNFMFMPVYSLNSNINTNFYNIENRKLRPVLDKTHNFINNVKGDEIRYDKFLLYSDILRKINIIFVIGKTKSALQEVAGLTNTIQNLELEFNEPEDHFIYNFGAVIPDTKNKTLSIGLSPKYSDISDFLYKHLREIDRYKYDPKADNWSELRSSFSMLKDHEYEANLIVLIGEMGTAEEQINQKIVEDIAYNNCRIMGVQLYGGRPNEFNNFVLQIQDMIERSSVNISNYKRDLIIYPDQVVQKNEFTKAAANTYRLDFPKKSMTQGYIIFPSKDEFMDPNRINICVDSILNEIKYDNQLLTSSMNKAFYEVGNSRNRYDYLISKTYNMDTTQAPNDKFVYSFKNEIPFWYTPNKIETYKKSDVNFDLLLSEKELKDLQNFISNLSREELDYASFGKTDTVFSSSHRVRKNLKKLFVDELRTDRPYKESKSTLKDFTINTALERIMSCKPQYEGAFKNIKIRNIGSKSILNDKYLDKLITYFKKKKEVFNKNVNKFPQFESNGEKYYWVNQKYLP